MLTCAQASQASPIKRRDVFPVASQQFRAQFPSFAPKLEPPTKTKKGFFRRLREIGSMGSMKIPEAAEAASSPTVDEPHIITFSDTDILGEGAVRTRLCFALCLATCFEVSTLGNPGVDPHLLSLVCRRCEGKTQWRAGGCKNIEAAKVRCPSSSHDNHTHVCTRTPHMCMEATPFVCSRVSIKRFLLVNGSREHQPVAVLMSAAVALLMSISQWYNCSHWY